MTRISDMGIRCIYELSRVLISTSECHAASQHWFVASKIQSVFYLFRVDKMSTKISFELNTEFKVRQTTRMDLCHIATRNPWLRKQGIGL